MDFLLGILTGVALCLVYGNYLNIQRKKEQTKEVNRLVDAWVRSFHRHQTPSTPLDQQLQDAIDREDYAAAARLRDLINKK